MRRALFFLLIAVVGCRRSKTQPTYDTTVISAAEQQSIAAVEDRLKFLEGLKGTLPPPKKEDDEIKLDPTDHLHPYWVNEENLADISGDTKGIATEDVTFTHDCAMEARHPPFGTHTYAKLQTCGVARYAFVIRTTSRIAPAITKYANKKEDGTFRPGIALGDVVVYDFKTKKVVGQFRWTAIQSSQSLDPQHLDADFERALTDSLSEAQHKFVTDDS